jgi:L-ascorbate metabolism protein UlaG (beta-lactamase superfamily)
MVVTMTGADAVTLLEMLQPRRALPIHYDDYGVFKSGVEDMRRAAVKADLSVHVRYLQRGELISL